MLWGNSSKRKEKLGTFIGDASSSNAHVLSVSPSPVGVCLWTPAVVQVPTVDGAFSTFEPASLDDDPYTPSCSSFPYQVSSTSATSNSPFGVITPAPTVLDFSQGMMLDTQLMWLLIAAISPNL